MSDAKKLPWLEDALRTADGESIDLCVCVLDDLIKRLADINDWAEREMESLLASAYDMEYGSFSAMVNMVNGVREILDRE